MADIPISGVQIGVDFLLSLLAGAGGWILKSMREDHKELEREHKSFENDVHRDFARKEDVRDAFADLKVVMRRIEDKLDRRPSP